jgi:hypothetical protein
MIEWREKYIDYYKLKKLIIELNKNMIIEKKKKLDEDMIKIFENELINQFKMINEFSLEEEEKILETHDILQGKNEFQVPYF